MSIPSLTLVLPHGPFLFQSQTLHHEESQWSDYHLQCPVLASKFSLLIGKVLTSLSQVVLKWVVRQSGALQRDQ